MSIANDGSFRRAPIFTALLSAAVLVFVTTYAAEASVATNDSTLQDCFTCLAEGDAGCGAGEHRDYMGASFLQGTFHIGCTAGQTPQGFCGTHDWCNVSLNLVKDVSRLIATREVDSLMHRIGEEPLLSFDVEKEAVHVHSCNGEEILITIPLSASSERLRELMTVSMAR